MYSTDKRYRTMLVLFKLFRVRFILFIIVCALQSQIRRFTGSCSLGYNAGTETKNRAEQTKKENNK